MALDLQFSCQANSSSVFQVVSQVATQMSHWAWVDIVEAKHTIKTFVRNWRNIGTPVWIQVRERRDGHDSISELHILWEQTLDPLNYPDLYDFLDGFAQQQKAQGLGCTTLSTDVGL